MIPNNTAIIHKIVRFLEKCTTVCLFLLGLLLLFLLFFPFVFFFEDILSPIPPPFHGGFTLNAAKISFIYNFPRIKSDEFFVRLAL